MRKIIDAFIMPVSGIIYYIIIRSTGISLFCPVFAVTGIKCPGCGITRSIIHLVRGDFVTALNYNCVIVLLIPFFLAGYIRYAFCTITNKVFYLKNYERKLISLLPYILFLFTIIRNIF